MADCGRCYGLGLGVDQDNTLAFSYYEQAAMAGSEFSCYTLGRWYDHGWFGLPQDEAQAKKWYEKMSGCAGSPERRNGR